MPCGVVLRRYFLCVRFAAIWSQHDGLAELPFRCWLSWDSRCHAGARVDAFSVAFRLPLAFVLGVADISSRSSGWYQSARRKSFSLRRFEIVRLPFRQAAARGTEAVCSLRSSAGHVSSTAWLR